MSALLSPLDRVDPHRISLGLESVLKVRRALRCHPEFPVIVVGGTNGKGSTCAMLEAILSGAGYRVGCYTSPHLLRFNERIRLHRQPIGDAELARVLARVEQARSGVPLTYFELGTLAAVKVFIDAQVDVAVLEVGLGGRLDAVNVFDADCAVITSVALDHTELLGATREAIALEKAGIFRRGRPAVCTEPDIPASLREQASRIEARLLEIGRDFRFEAGLADWRFMHHEGPPLTLPYPALGGRFQLYNASAAIAALCELRNQLPVAPEHIRAGLSQVNLAGRFQIFPGRPAVVLDVAHNPHAAAGLAENLQRLGGSGRTLAVLAMLEDKDAEGVAGALRERIDRWFVADLQEPRGARAGQLLQALARAQVRGPAAAYPDPMAAYEAARQAAGPEDVIVVFGSFRTVAAVLDGGRHVEPAGSTRGDGVPECGAMSSSRAWPSQLHAMRPTPP